MITVGLEPEATDLQRLPAPIEDAELAKAPPARPQGRALSLVGGLSFTNAPEIQPGRYRVELGLDESAVVSIPVAWGQQLSASATLRTPPKDTSITIDGYGPDLGPAGGSIASVSSSNSALVNSGDVGSVDFAFPQVRYLNRGSAYGSITNAARAGNYYLIVVAEPLQTDDASPGELATVELDIVLNGEAGSGPTYLSAEDSTDPLQSGDQTVATEEPKAIEPDTPTDTAEAVTAERDDGTPTHLVWLAGGSAVVLLAAGGALWALLRRRT